MSTPELRTRELMEDLRSRIDVGPAPIAELERGGRRRRQTRQLALGVAAALVVGSVAATAVVLSRNEPEVLSPVKVGLDAPWWADGYLQVGGRAVPLSSVDQVVDTSAGVVAAQATGDVVLVGADGDVTVIGHRAWGPADMWGGYRLLVDDSTGQVCWIDKGITGQQLIVVYDPVAGREVARHRIDTAWPDPAQLFAFEDGVVYYDQRDGGNTAWTVDSGETEKLGSHGASFVMDVENDVWVTLDIKPERYQIRQDRQVVANLGNHYYWWQLSADARWLVGRYPVAGRTGDTGPFEVAVWDVATGEERATGLPPDVLVEGVWPDADGRIAYAVAHSLNGPVDLVSCDVQTATCTTVVEHAADAAPLVMAEDFMPVEKELS